MITFTSYSVKEQDPPVYYIQYCHFDKFVLLTSSRLDGDYVSIPT